MHKGISTHSPQSRRAGKPPTRVSIDSELKAERKTLSAELRNLLKAKKPSTFQEAMPAKMAVFAFIRIHA
jgi:hypothetical protein